MILRIRATIAAVEESQWDLFYTDDGTVSSRKSNWEWGKKYWWAPGPAIAKKELEELEFTATLRASLTRMQEFDIVAEGRIQNLLEQVPISAREALIPMPSDPELAKILVDYQTDASKSDMQVWPSGSVLDAIRMVDPTFQGRAMTEEEVAQMKLLYTSRGTGGVIEFFQIKSDAETMAESQYPDTREAQQDGHGDAFRHAYWNARMTQEFGADWTESYTTAHEKTGGNPPAREAMDLYNNERGREIGKNNPNASAEELAAKINADIGGGKMIVLSESSDTGTPQVAWSNSVEVGKTKVQPGVDIPLPQRGV